MARQRNDAILFILCITALIVGCGMVAAENAVPEPKRSLRDDFLVDDSFTTHLPLLILIPAPAASRDATDSLVDLRLIAGVDGVNRPDLPPVAVSRAILEQDAETDSGGGKIQATLRLINDRDADNPLGLLAMPTAPAWSIVGTTRDRGMLHNGLARRLAEAIAPDRTPAARYCEVLIREGDKYRYLGLHLLSEYLEDGIWQSPRALADKRFLARADGENTARHGRETRFVQVYPPPASGDAFPNELNRIAQTLASDLPSTYLRHMSRLDIDAILDAYILSLALMNDPPGSAFYWYENHHGGRIGIVPLWDFTASLDNLREAVEGQVGLLTRYAWLNDLLRSSDFIERLKQRYFQLRRGVLAPERLEATADGIAAELGAALERDWQRWESVYVPPDAERIISVEQELLKIRHYLRMQGESMKYTLLQLHLRQGLINNDLDSRWNAVMAVSLIVLFLLLAAYCRNRF